MRALGLAGAVWALGAAGGCASYSSERAQFESRRVTVHAVGEPAPSRAGSGKVASLRDGDDGPGG
jgi:hypothetical protein